MAPEVVVFALCSSRVINSLKADVANKLLSTPRPEEFEVGGNQPVVLGVDHHESLTDMIDEDSWLVFSAL